jgi:hypothetical protein
VLAPLRRPQTKADLPPQLRQTLPTLQPLIGSPILSLVRYATAAPWHVKLYLVPFGPPSRSAIIRWTTQRHLSSRARQRTVRRIEAEWKRLGDHVSVTVLPSSSAGGTATDIEDGQVWTTWGWGHAIMIVPDGVARVTLQRAHLTAVVHNNVAAFLLPNPVNNLGALGIKWYSRNGTVIKPIPVPHG